MTISTAIVASLLREQLASGKQATLTIVSGSMRPLLAVNDQVVIRAVSADDLQPGDIIVVEGTDALYTHRYYGRSGSEQRLVTRGDRPLAWDPPWSASMLVGQVVQRIRTGRRQSLDSVAGAQRVQQLVCWETAIFAGPHVPTEQTLANPATRLIAQPWRHGARKPFFYLIRYSLYSLQQLLLRL